MMRRPEGSAGDADYGVIGGRYADYRQPEPAIEALIARALGDARSVLNVGAGAGSYEPRDRQVTAVEPSAAMRAQRPAGLMPAIDAVAEQLPFADGQFDAAMTTFSVHQWRDVRLGLREMRRVTRGPVVIMSCDPNLVRRFWLNDYAPGVLDAEARRYPTMGQMAVALGGRGETIPVPIPWDCRDGFNEAYYARPERLLDPGARTSCSAWSFVPPESAAASIEALRRDLASGAWDERHGHLREQTHYDGSLRLLVALPGRSG
jgi:SAM-dependent methyltransferase